MCEKCYKEEQRHRASSRSRSRLDSSTSNNIDTVTAIEITELNSQEDLIAQAMVETTTILADEGDENRCSRCKYKYEFWFHGKKQLGSIVIFFSTHR